MQAASHCVKFYLNHPCIRVIMMCHLCVQGFWQARQPQQDAASAGAAPAAPTHSQEAHIWGRQPASRSAAGVALSQVPLQAALVCMLLWHFSPWYFGALDAHCCHSVLASQNVCGKIFLTAKHPDIGNTSQCLSMQGVHVTAVSCGMPSVLQVAMASQQAQCVRLVVDALLEGRFSKVSVVLHMYEALQALIHDPQVWHTCIYSG